MVTLIFVRGLCVYVRVRVWAKKCSYLQPLCLKQLFIGRIECLISVQFWKHSDGKMFYQMEALVLLSSHLYSGGFVDNFTGQMLNENDNQIQ